MNAVHNGEKVVIPSVFNQALMELGATVCVPNGAPHCKNCPWYELCEARKQGRMDEIPVKTKAKARRIEKKTVLIVKDGEQLALHKREDKGLLAGLYELPNVEGHLLEDEIVNYVKAQGYEPIRIQALCDAKHIFSHVEWHMKGYVVFIASRELCAKGQHRELKKDMQDWIFVDEEDTKNNYAIPSAFSRYAEYLNLVLGKDAIE